MFLDSISMCFGYTAPKIGGVLMKNIFKRLIYPFFPKNGQQGGGVLPDFTRRGTNYLHTTLLKKYPKSNFLDSQSMFFGFSTPKIRGGPHKNIFKRLIYPFFPKNGPRGGGAFYQISPDVALTTCMQLLLEMTLAIYPLGPIPTVFGFSSPKIGGVLMKTF